MYFLISPGDQVAVAPAKPSELRSGDIALLLLLGPLPSYVVHRVRSRIGEGADARIVTQGDAAQEPDAQPSLLAGRVEAVGKQDQWYGLSGSKAQSFWRALPMLARLVHGALRLEFALEHAALTACRLLPPQRGEPWQARLRLMTAWWAFNERLLKPALWRACEWPSVALLSWGAADYEAPAEPHVRFGRVMNNARWSGTIHIAGDVIVAAGAQLTLAPGTRLVFSQQQLYESGWTTNRVGLSGLHEIPTTRPRLLVFGCLVAEGTAEQPIILEGKNWGGVHFMGGSLGSRLEHATLRGAENAAVTCWDRAEATLRSCAILESRFGVAAYGLGRVEILGGMIDSRENACLLIEDAAKVSCRSLRLLARETAVLVSSEGAETLLEDCTLLSEHGPTIRLGPASRLAGRCLRLESVSQVGIELAPRSHLRLLSARISSARAGLTLAATASATLKDVTVESRGPGLSLASRAAASIKRGRIASAQDVGICAEKGSALEIEDASVDSRLAALRLMDSTASLKRVSLRSMQQAAAVVQGGHLSLSDCSLSGAEALLAKGRARVEARGGRLDGRSAGARTLGAQLALSDLNIASSTGHGLELDAARLSARRVRVNAAGGACAALDSDVSASQCAWRGAAFSARLSRGRSRLEGCTLTGGSKAGLDLRGGNHELQDSCVNDAVEPGLARDDAARVRAGGTFVLGRPWPSPPPPRRALPWRLLLAIVLKTRMFPGLRLLYRGAYAAAAAQVRWLAHRTPILEGALVYRGWTSGDWQAGISDLDFQFIFASGSKPAKDEARLRGFWRRYSALRHCWPMLGEALVCTREELNEYLADGGARAQEFRAFSRPLAGPPAVERLASPANAVASITEAFYAYTRLMVARYAQASEHPERVRQNLRKALLDTLRYSDEALRPGKAVSRGDYERALRCRLPEAAEALTRSDPNALCTLAFRHLDTTCLALSDALCQPIATTGEPRYQAPRAGRNEGRLADIFTETLSRFRADLGLNTAGFQLDDGYRFYCILPDEPPGAALEAFWPALESLRQRHSFLHTVPMPVSRRSWEVLSQSAFMHHPTAFLDADLGDGGDAAGACGLQGFRQLRLNVPSLTRRWSATAARAAAEQSQRHLRLSWRSSFFEGTPAACAHRLYTRSLGLRLLLERGLALSFTRLEPVLAAACETLPDTASWIRQLDFSDLDHESLPKHYAFLESQL